MWEVWDARVRQPGDMQGYYFIVADGQAYHSSLPRSFLARKRAFQQIGFFNRYRLRKGQQGRRIAPLRLEKPEDVTGTVFRNASARLQQGCSDGLQWQFLTKEVFCAKEAFTKETL